VAADNSTSPLPTCNIAQTLKTAPNQHWQTSNQKPAVLHTTELASSPTFIDERLQNITNQRARESEYQIVQAERMVKHSRIDLKLLK
jgi:hypothetical protein